LEAFNGVSKRLLEFKDYFTRSGVPRENLPRLLRLGRERRGQKSTADHDHERASLHQGPHSAFPVTASSSAWASLSHSIT
jgi:hypothetical protein